MNQKPINLAWRARYALLCLARVPLALVNHPAFTCRITLARLLFLFTRRFCGPSFRSPITGELIFNCHSLINAFAMQIMRELDGPWMRHLRETPAPVVFDVGSNIGQFRALALSMNPGAIVHTFDPWPEMAAYVDPVRHESVALGSEGGSVMLQRSGCGWTASTAREFYRGQLTEVSVATLDRLWLDMGAPNVDVLKIDVDGAEAEVLAGAQSVLKHTRFLIVESKSPPHCEGPARRWTTANHFDFCGEATT